MAQIDNPTRIRAEDFEEKHQETVEKIGGIVNSFMEQVHDGFQKNINFENLNQETLDLTVKVDSNGEPTQTTRITSVVKSIQGMSVIRATNLTNTGTYPTSAPFISYEAVGNGVYTIKNVTGIQQNQSYRLRVILIGDDA